MHSIIGKLTLEAIEKAARLSDLEPVALALALVECARQ
jgi:hypothetical protein